MSSGSQADRARSPPQAVDDELYQQHNAILRARTERGETPDEIAASAKKLGYQYIVISDHSKSERIANGLSVKAMKQHIKTIREANEKIKGIEILVSAEVDILGDGSLDYPDEVLEECDIVIASIHSGLSQDRQKVTARTLAAIRSPYVNIIGHPTGRMLGQREAMDLDMDAVIQEAAETGTALELNASWQRLDLCDLHVRKAVEAGAMVAISTDAHSIDQMAQFMSYGVCTARRGWAPKESILNVQSLRSLRTFVASKRTTIGG